MLRTEMINTVGIEYLKANVENEEFSYPKAYKEEHLDFIPISKGKRTFERVDIRFEYNGITVLIETKPDFSKEAQAEAQLAAYVEYEKRLTANKIVAILANTDNDAVKVWRGAVSDSDLLASETALKTMEEYIDLYTSKINNKEEVMRNTYHLNETLHGYGISERLRSQFVGTCLLALKNGFVYNTPTMTANQIRTGIRDVLENLLTKDLNKASKLTLIDKNVLNSQDVRSLPVKDFRAILDEINSKILPFINDKSTSGQDLLNLFFTMFNKYVGKNDKNQAFTPDHITDFMAKICGVNKNSVVMDICCGSGAFLVRAMTQALDDCATAKEQEHVKKHQIYGIEYDENIYGLATTNMLIHSDGNSNIIQGSCYDYKDWIQNAKPTVVLMNPPYNAQKKHLPEEYTKKWGANQKEDPSKGLYFVKYICDTLNEIKCSAKVAVLLPVSCAIGTAKEIANLKVELLKQNTLDAVFTLPAEVFYPGAAVSACCMVFTVGVPNNSVSNPDTFFGYYKEDGFKKKKNLGRIEQKNAQKESIWQTEIEPKWIDLYRNRKAVDGLSATHKVDGNAEWLCEAYMKTDYSKLSEDDFQQTLNNYLAYLMREGKIYEA